MFSVAHNLLVRPSREADNVLFRPDQAFLTLANPWQFGPDGGVELVAEPCRMRLRIAPLPRKTARAVGERTREDSNFKPSDP